MSFFSFSVDGEPVPKGRPRCTIRPDGSPHIYTPETTKAAEEEIAYTFKQAYPGHEPLNGELSVLIMVVTRKSRLNRQSADIDNYAKTALDALNGVAWVDDRQIVHLSVHISPDLEGEPYLNVQFKTLGESG